METLIELRKFKSVPDVFLKKHEVRFTVICEELQMKFAEQSEYALLISMISELAVVYEL